jgi:hypothetical protein
MIRFVLDPEGRVVPDVKRRLPGRGAWIDARRESVDTAVARRVFNRAFRAQVNVPETLGEEVDRLLTKSALDRLSMARKAGLVVLGFEKVRALLSAGHAAGLVIASDAARDGRSKLEALAKKASDLHNVVGVAESFSSAELEIALGRERVVNAALSPGRLSELFMTDAERLRAYRFGETLPATHREHQPDEQKFAGPEAV